MITNHPKSGGWIEWRSDTHDQDWNKEIELNYKINPDLDEPTKEALSLDYDLDEKGVLNLRCRKAMEIYLRYRYEMIDSRLGLRRWVEVKS